MHPPDGAPLYQTVFIAGSIDLAMTFHFKSPRDYISLENVFPVLFVSYNLIVLARGPHMIIFLISRRQLQFTLNLVMLNFKQFRLLSQFLLESLFSWSLLKNLFLRMLNLLLDISELYFLLLNFSTHVDSLKLFIEYLLSQFEDSLLFPEPFQLPVFQLSFVMVRFGLH